MTAVGFPASKALTCDGDDPRFHAEIACQVLVAVSVRGIRRLPGGEAQPSVGILLQVVERVSQGIPEGQRLSFRTRNLTGEARPDFRGE